MKAPVVVAHRSLLARAWLVALALLVAAAIAPALATAASTPNAALIDEESVTLNDGIEKEGTPISLEQYAAERAGFAVTVRSGAEWETMSAEEFAHYQVLIVGDPDCAATTLSAINSAHTWIPVVMGASGLNPLVGNRTVVGTDPEFHYAAGDGGAQPREPGNPSSAGAEHLVQDGIAFAGARAEATGVYLDTSCTDQPEPGEAETLARAAGVHPASVTQEEIEGPDGLVKTQVLDHLTVTGEEWGEDSSPPCGGEVQQVAANAAFDEGPTKLTDEDIQGWGCSDHVTFPTFPADWFPLAVATDTPSHPTCGTDPETSKEVCGEAYVLLAGANIVAEAPNLSLTPRSASGEAGPTHTHTVTANVHKEEHPVPGTPVTFVVTEQNAGVAGTCSTGSGAPDPECKTDENGDVQFTYADVNGAGQDTIIASVTLESPIEEVEEEVRPSATVGTVKTTEHATATREWIAPATVPAAVPSQQQQQQSPPPPPAAKAGVLAFGRAHLASHAGACVAASGYLASVTGKQIASVRFTLDGHRLKTLRHPKHGAFALRIRVRAGKRHHLSIRVRFTAASHTRPKTIHRTLARCAAVHRVVEPRFTG